MACLIPAQEVNTDTEPYRLHVSQRYLDLTQEKLELARIPREPPAIKGGVSGSSVLRAELESLLDYWLESYNHRAQEEQYNNRLPQYRTNLAITNTIVNHPDTKVPNIHFVHRKSSSKNAIPLLVCHDWGSSFIEVARMVESLCEPISTPTPHRSSERAFHVVCPSMPGFGFSDASSDPEFGLEGAADVLHALMLKLGYRKFMLHGSRWGFLVCRTLAMRHPGSCIALHTADLEVPPPSLKHAPLAWASYHIARLTKARYPLLSFGYVPSDFDTNTAASLNKIESRNHQSSIGALATRTQMLAYALADSPTGLLALTLDLIRPLNHWSISSLSSSPSSSSATPAPSLQDPWSPSEIIFWTMMYWLPGPEAPLRWLRNAARDSSDTGRLWDEYCNVPLGISHFRASGCGGGLVRSLPGWASVYQDLRWVRRHAKEVCRPAWEAPEELIMDLRAFVEEVGV